MTTTNDEIHDNAISSNNDNSNDASASESSPNNNDPCSSSTTMIMGEDAHYDVILCGTDLIQSILSSALSRAGKKVLHCDGNEWYGGFDAVLHVGSTLESFINDGCGSMSMQQGGKEEGKDGLVAPDENNNGEDDGKRIDSLLQLLPRKKYGHLRIHSQSFVTAKEYGFDATKAVMDSSPSGVKNLSIDDDTSEEKVEVANEDANNNGVAADDSLPKEPTSTQKQQPAVTTPLEHGFCFDLTPSLLYASGNAVEDLVKSGVADYLEFKSLKGLNLLMEEEGKSSTTRRSGRRSNRHTAGRGRAKGVDVGSSNGSGNGMDGDQNASEGKFASYRVPCSKGDVFRSKLLSPMDKRRLMKFLQLISDYGVATQFGDVPSSNEAEETETVEGASIPAADDDDNNNKISDDAKFSEPEAATTAGEDAIVQSINEHYLHRGRALSRPQNKATPSSSDLGSLMRCIEDGASFSDFLKNVAKLPERLATVVVYALALTPFGYLERDGTKGEVGNDGDGDDDTYRQISRYSTKAGVDDLVRHVTALGRFGDTAFLVTMYGSGELSQAFCRSGAVYGSTYMLRRSPLAISLEEGGRVRGVVLSGEEHIGESSDVDTEDVLDQTLFCEHVVVPSTMMCPSKGSKALQTRIYRRVCILQGKLILDQEKNDSKDGSDTEQRYAIIIPPGTGGLENKSAIHGVVADDSVCVAPRGKDYTVLHLTTSSQGDDGAPDELFVDAMSKAVEFLVASQPTRGNTAPVKELHHISFSYCTETPSFDEKDGIDSGGSTSGLHVCYRDGQSLTCDSAFREAKRIFERICPDSDFLALAKKVEDAILYRDEHDSDDEKMVLESACTMIQAPTAETPVLDDNVQADTSDV